VGLRIKRSPGRSLAGTGRTSRPRTKGWTRSLGRRSRRDGRLGLFQILTRPGEVTGLQADGLLEGGLRFRVLLFRQVEAAHVVVGARLVPSLPESLQGLVVAPDLEEGKPQVVE